MLQKCQSGGLALNGRTVGLSLLKCQSGPDAELWTSQGVSLNRCQSGLSQTVGHAQKGHI